MNREELRATVLATLFSAALLAVNAWILIGFWAG
jgi:hypothetical protein